MVLDTFFFFLDTFLYVITFYPTLHCGTLICKLKKKTEGITVYKSQSKDKHGFEKTR